MKTTVTAAAMCLAVAGCGVVDPYADDFKRIELGDTRGRAIELMGKPRSVASVELPMLTLETLTWKTPTGRVYLIFTARDHVLAKSALR
jgi:hypothetical protein